MCVDVSARSIDISATITIATLHSSGSKPVGDPEQFNASKRESASSFQVRSMAQSVLGEHVPFPIQKSIKPHYFLTKELPDRPLVLRDMPSDLGDLFPEVASQRIEVWLYINETGGIDQKLFKTSDQPPYAELLLHEQFVNMQFHPGKIDGIPVKSKLRIEVTIESAAIPKIDSNRSLVQ